MHHLGVKTGQLAVDELSKSPHSSDTTSAAPAIEETIAAKMIDAPVTATPTPTTT